MVLGLISTTLDTGGGTPHIPNPALLGSAIGTTPVPDATGHPRPETAVRICCSRSAAIMG